MARAWTYCLLPLPEEVAKRARAGNSWSSFGRRPHDQLIVAVCPILAQMDPASSEGIANILQRPSVASRRADASSMAPANCGYGQTAG